MYIQKRERGKKFVITVNRSTDEELDQAIKDLEERGFKFIKRGVSKGEVVCYSTSRRYARYEFAGTANYEKFRRSWIFFTVS